MSFFRWFKRVPWRKSRAAVFFRAGGRLAVCIPVCGLEMRRAGDFEYRAVSSRTSCKGSSAPLCFKVITRNMGPPERLLNILEEVSLIRPAGERTETPQHRLSRRLKIILAKMLNLLEGRWNV